VQEVLRKNIDKVQSKWGRNFFKVQCNWNSVTKKSS